MWHGGWIQTEGLVNARDLGGMPAAGGKTIRHHKILRSGMLALASEADIDCLIREHALSTVIDLRGDIEIAGAPDPVIEGVRYIKNPILDSEQLGISHEEDLITAAGKMPSGHDHMVRVYGLLVNEERAIGHFRQYLRYYLEPEDGAILCHCTAGKDRTCIGIALLLMALGVPQEIIMQDYMYTNDFSKEAMDDIMADVLIKTDDEATIQSARDMMLAKEEYIGTFMAGMVLACGSAEAFLEKRLGLDEETKAQLQAMYLE